MLTTAKDVSEKFRRLLYLSTPNETSFENTEDVPEYVNEAFPFFVGLIVLESLILLLQGKPLPRLNDSFSSLSAGVLSLLHGLMFRSFELVCYMWVFEHFNVITLAWQSPWTWMVGFIGVDFGYYWLHRCGHEVNIFWSGHQAHHSSEEYNLTTALRQSAILRYFTWMFYLPLALFVPPSIFLVHTQFNLLYQFWIHTEVIRSLGPLEYLINTPSHHRLHHGRNPYCIDKNYGGTLIIWDRLFGTFEWERESEKVAYGLVHPVTSWEPIYVQFCHLIHIVKTAKNLDGINNKISAFLKGPGWLPGKPRLGHKEDIPMISHPVRKYDSDLTWWASLYVWFHFASIVISYIVIASYQQTLPVLYLVLYVIFTTVSLSTFGLLYDGREWASLVETCRCVLLMTTMHCLGLPRQFTINLVSAVYIIHFLSMLLWGYVAAVKFINITRQSSKHH